MKDKYKYKNNRSWCFNSWNFFSGNSYLRKSIPFFDIKIPYMDFTNLVLVSDGGIPSGKNNRFSFLEKATFDEEEFVALIKDLILAD